MIRFLILMCIVVLVPSSNAQARTWRVERDGSGDSATIQAAINSSAVGDTILLGAGRYTESFDWEWCNHSWTDPVYAAVTVDSLTIRGVSRDEVIIGPEIASWPGTEERGIVVECAVTACWIEDVTLQNLFDGVYTYSSGGISRCVTRDCRLGFNVVRVDYFTVQSSEFLGAENGGRIIADSAVVKDCVFAASQVGLRIGQTPNGVVRDTRIEGGRVSLIVEGWSVAAVENCTLTGAVVASVSLSSSSVQLDGNFIGAALRPIMGEGVCALSGTGNIVQAGELETMNFQASVDLAFRGNNISPSPAGLAVYLDIPAEPGDYVLDMTGNYWGTSDPDSVAAMIWDGGDDPSIPIFVEYLPISDTSVGTERKGFGGLKSMFR